MMTAQPSQTGFRRRIRLSRRPRLTPHPAQPRPERRDCQGRIAAQLLAVLGESWSVSAASFRPWCSATFIGAQHRLTLAYEGAHAIDRALTEARRLPDLEFRVAGHVVADLSIEAVRESAPGMAQVELALLTVEDW